MSKLKQYISKPDTTTSSERIAFVGNTAFSLYNFRLGVMKSFVEKGYTVFAIAPGDKYSPLFAADDITFINLKIDGKGTNVLTDIMLFCRMIKIYKSHSFDFVFHYTVKPIIYGSFVCRLLKINTIAVTTGLGYTFDAGKWLNLFVVSLYRKSLQKVKEVWFLNQDNMDVFLKKHIVEESRSFVLNSEGLDTDFFIPKPKAMNEDKFVFLFLSRLVKEKGIEEFVLAAKFLRQKYPNTEFQVLGKTDIQNPHNIPVTKLIEWDREGVVRYFEDAMDVRTFIADSDCVVLPSYYGEGVPRCLMEAMSMERPIITTDNVGCKELIEHNINGKMCAFRDVESLAKMMEEMYLLDAAERNEMGKNGRRKMLEQYDEKLIIDVYHHKTGLYIN
jgi:glycosyltransferase involved in cell wall biosynthesis